MKKIVWLIVVCLLCIVNTQNAYCQNLVGGKWVIQENKLNNGTSDLITYRRDSSVNMIDLSKFSIIFNVNNTYSAISVDGDTVSGTWQLSNGELTVGTDTNTFFFVNNDTFQTTTTFQVPDVSQTPVTYLPTQSMIRYVRVSSTGIEMQQRDNMFSIYPNPSSETVMIKWSSKSSDNAILKIYDNVGKLVDEVDLSNLSSQNTMDYNVSKFAPGLYIFNLKTDKGTTTIKFIKQE